MQSICWRRDAPTFPKIGLTQIRFPQGDVMSKSEAIRQVLEREGTLRGCQDAVCSLVYMNLSSL